MSTVTGISLAHFLMIFFVAALGEGGQFWNWSIVYNGGLQVPYFFSKRYTSSQKIRHLKNSILHNRLVPNLAPLPQGATKKFRKKCARLLPVTVICIYYIHTKYGAFSVSLDKVKG